LIPYTVETNRLLLRPYQDEDLDPLYEIQRDSKAMQYTIYVEDRQEAEKRFKAFAALLDRIGYAPWTVVLKQDERIIGWGGLNIDPFDSGWGTEVAYFFHPDYWNRGFATELVMASLREGFTHLNLDMIGAFARRENRASIRVLEKCGFKYTGYVEKLNRNRYEVYRTYL
jgi:ribosomal-protein-alanine N-acetyltransferase